MKPSAPETIGAIGAGFLGPAGRGLPPDRRLVTSKGAAESGGQGPKASAKPARASPRPSRMRAGALIGPLLLLGIVGLAVAGRHVRDRGRSRRLDAGRDRAGACRSPPRITRRRPHHLVAAPLLQAAPRERLRAQAGEAGVARRGGAPPGRGAGAEDPAADEGLAIERDYDELVPLSETALKRKRPNGAGRRCSSARRRTSPTAGRRRRAGGSPASPSAPTRVGGPLVGAVTTTGLEAPSNKREWEQPRDRAVPRPGSGQAGGLPQGGGPQAPAPRPAAGGGGDVRGGDLALDGQDDAAAAEVPDGARQRPARGLGAEPTLGAPQRDETGRCRARTPPRPFYLLYELLGRNRRRAGTST